MIETPTRIEDHITIVYKHSVSMVTSGVSAKRIMFADAEGNPLPEPMQAPISEAEVIQAIFMYLTTRMTDLVRQSQPFEATKQATG